MPRCRASSTHSARRLDLPMPGGPSTATALPRPATAAASASSSARSSDSRSSRLGSLVAVGESIESIRKLGVGFGGAPDAAGGPLVDYRGMSAADEPVTAHVELVLEEEGVRGVLRAQHTPDLPFSG